MIDAINDCLNVNSFAGPYGKGLILLRNGKVMQSEYYSITGLGTAIVQGSKKYFVTINYDKKKNRIEAICTYPYDWGGLCKHEIAFLLDLKNKYGQNDGKQPAQTRIKSGSKGKIQLPKPAIIKDYQHITKEQVEKITHANVLSLTSTPDVMTSE
jgi:hypothetical protein